MIRILLTILIVLVATLSMGHPTTTSNGFRPNKYTIRDSSKSVKYKSATATWYGGGFHGKLTANGEKYDMNTMTCATRNREIPFNTKIEITCVETGKKVIVRVNNRMAKHARRNFDLSTKAFKKIAPLNKGVLTIKYRLLD